MRENRATRDGVAVAAKAEGLWEGTGWGKGDYTSVRADEIAGKINNLSGRRLFGSLLWKVKRAFFPLGWQNIKKQHGQEFGLGAENADLAPFWEAAPLEKDPNLHGAPSRQMGVREGTIPPFSSPKHVLWSFLSNQKHANFLQFKFTNNLKELFSK